MEAAQVVKIYGGVASYSWKRRGYRRLESLRPPSSPGRKARRLGAGWRRGWRRLLRLRRLSLRIRLRLSSPVKVIGRIRDAYVDCMLVMAGKAAGLPALSAPALWSKRIPKRRPATTKASEIERRLIVEIYRSLVMSGQIEEPSK